VEIPIHSDEHGGVVAKEIPLKEFTWVDLLAQGVRNRGLREVRHEPAEGFDPARVTAACIWVQPRAKAAIRIKELLWIRE
jgi:hypothetical protein